MKSIHAKNAISLIAVASLCAIFGREYLLSALVGGLVQVVNLYFLDRATSWI